MVDQIQLVRATAVVEPVVVVGLVVGCVVVIESNLVVWSKRTTFCRHRVSKHHITKVMVA